MASISKLFSQPGRGEAVALAMSRSTSINALSTAIRAQAWTCTYYFHHSAECGLFRDWRGQAYH